MAGYIVYYDTDSGYPFANSIDVGNVTSYTITSLDTASNNYYVTVTAYDNVSSYGGGGTTDDGATIVNEIQTSGNESWHSTEVNTAP